MKKNRRVMFTICIIFFMMILMSSSEAEQNKKRKKLFVNNITPKKGVEKTLTDKVRDHITLSVFENYGRYYHIVTDEDIKVMYQKAELMMATGSDSENAVVQVANAINADEIIYGNIIKEGDRKLRITVQNLLRDSSTQTVSKKSFVNMSFFESKLEWYCREIAKKLINPKHKIDPRRAVSKITAKFEVEDIRIKEFKGLNIKKIKFEYDDEISQRIVKDLEKIVQKGDKLYKKKKYSKALKKYRETIKTIGLKLRKETQNKITPFTASVLERIAAVHSMDCKKAIEKIDKWLKAQKSLDVKKLKKGKEQYEKIVRHFAKLPSHERKVMSSIFQSLEDRLTAIYMSWISVYERKGDVCYGEYQFKKALKFYDAGRNLIAKSGVRNPRMTEAKERLTRKRKVAVDTGGSWLENKVVSYCNAAEYLNMKNKRRRAKKYLAKARKLIELNQKFANKRMVTAYKETARIMKRR
ncbi:MAG: hypothetical protein SVZ03_09485 [Spirochaetota bacterium]|nr:hypothetical protein [Spirochaetota bacterium]